MELSKAIACMVTDYGQEGTGRLHAQSSNADGTCLSLGTKCDIIQSIANQGSSPRSFF